MNIFVIPSISYGLPSIVAQKIMNQDLWGECGDAKNNVSTTQLTMHVHTQPSSVTHLVCRIQPCQIRAFAKWLKV